MPIPSPGIHRPSGLTKKQQQEQLAAIYGVPPNMEQFSHEDIARMKIIVAQHDAKNAGPIQTIDLNNPPRTPYRHQDFPQMVYDLDASTPQKIVHHIVESKEELEAALEAGWSTDAPAYGEEREEVLSVALQTEALGVQEKIDAENAKVAKKPASKPKAKPGKKK